MLCSVSAGLGKVELELPTDQIDKALKVRLISCAFTMCADGDAASVCWRSAVYTQHLCWTAFCRLVLSALIWSESKLIPPNGATHCLRINGTSRGLLPDSGYTR